MVVKEEEEEGRGGRRKWARVRVRDVGVRRGWVGLRREGRRGLVRRGGGMVGFLS